ncbi:MAG: DUF2062 domain-containing protein [Hyphomicrobium sp.]|nr:DUF2062 domain-containing protein [Hyphomicrobium sp.]
MLKQIRRRVGMFGAFSGLGASEGRSLREAWTSVLRLDTTPHAVGLGLATGVFVAFLPVLGIQMLVAAAIAWAGRANIGAALLGTGAGNPLTWPAMWIASYLLGIMLLGETSAITIEELERTLMRLAETPVLRVDPLTMLNTAGKLLWPILKPLFVGSMVLGLISGSALYFIGRRAAEAFHTRRQQQA